MPPNNDRAARLCYLICSNIGLIYGTQFLGWHFFPILYLFWWEELISTFFATQKLKKLRPFLLKTQTEQDVLAREGGVMLRYFFLFVWLVFVIVLGVFVMAPKASWGVNITTFFFQNRLFNLNLLGFFGLQLLSFFPRFLKKNNPEASSDEVEDLSQMMDRRGIIIHVGMIFGAFLGHFFHVGWFVWGFLFVKIGADLVGFFSKKAEETASFDPINLFKKLRP